MGNYIAKNTEHHSGDKTADKRDSSTALTISAQIVANIAPVSPPITFLKSLAVDKKSSYSPGSSPAPAKVLPMKRPPTNGSSFLAPAIPNRHSRRLLLSDSNQATSSRTHGASHADNDSSDDSDDDDAPVSTRQLHSSRRVSSSRRSSSPSGSGSAEPSAPGDSPSGPIVRPPFYGTGLMSAQAAYFKSLRYSRPGSYPFMTVFLQGSHIHFNNDEIPVHYHQNGRNYRQVTGDLKEIHVFECMEGLGMKIPKDLSIATMPNYVDPKLKIGVNDSESQERLDKTVEELLAEFPKSIEERATIFNNLTTQTAGQVLDDHIQLPSFVREHSMLGLLEEALKKQTTSRKITNLLKKIPKYEKFLFLSLAGCFTDGHIDMASTSVYTHIHEGEKHFFFAKNTPENIEIFKTYEKDFYNYNWIGELLAGQWRRVVLEKGSTIFIPGSYIHFVWTPVDTIMIGGNFLMESNLQEQFDMAKFEEEKYVKRLEETGEGNRTHLFPDFTQLMWAYVEFVLLPRLQDYKNATDPDNLLSMTSVFLKELDPEIRAFPYQKKEMKNIKEKLEEMVQKIKSERRKRGCIPSTSGPAPVKKSKN